MPKRPKDENDPVPTARSPRTRTKNAKADDPLLAIAKIAERTLLFTKYADHDGPMIERLIARRLAALRHAASDKHLCVREHGRTIDDEQELEQIFTKLFAEIPKRFADAKRDLSMREIVADAVAILAERGIEIAPTPESATSLPPSSSAA